MKLKKWVKVVLTLIIAYISVLIWQQMETVGLLAKQSNLYLVLCGLGWFYLLVGQVLIYAKLWK